MKCFVIPVITGAMGIVSKSLKISGNNTGTVFNRFSKKTAILDLKPEWLGSPLVQEEKYQGKENL
jgi:hypothetical protein